VSDTTGDAIYSAAGIIGSLTFMKNTHYTRPADLLADEGFLAWYHHTDETKVKEWNEWIADNLFNQVIAEEAVYLLGRAGIEDAGITDKQIREAAKYFIQRIVETEKQTNLVELSK